MQYFAVTMLSFQDTRWRSLYFESLLYSNRSPNVEKVVTMALMVNPNLAVHVHIYMYLRKKIVKTPFNVDK